ncbi:FecR family protein [Aureibaculum sp. A20]|uniref:FecR family protein n=1 Tax=Aureibaculum flavum TaxID=2795986 RepID=A0ABS0WNW2_9FLAO|nr:FecR domain-containing protein [Aureibaculum flavum]MBJ2173672.1 FecR family protein [Aureibaculum flavum]
MKDKRNSEMNISPISENEKLHVKNKIFNSVRKDKIKKKRLASLIGVAASISIIIVLSLYSSNEPTPSIIDYVKSSNGEDSNSTDVTLILGQGENHKVDEKLTTIDYSSNGKKITVGSTEVVEQEVSKNNEITYNTLIVPYGKRSKIKLSDGSIIWLNSGSKLVYPPVFNGEKREVYLEGEAIFDVAHNKKKPFVVVSNSQEVRVLGTVFGVSDYKDENDINTVLKSGSVQISYHNNSSSKRNRDKIKITPGTLANYNKSKKSIISKKVNVDNYFSWRDGVLIFNKDELDFILKKLSRHYNVQIELTDNSLMHETFSGLLNLNEDLDKVIQTIEESANLEEGILKINTNI